MTPSAASKHEIRAWLKRAVELGATHMLVVTDTYDYGDYPVNVFWSDSLSDVITHHNNIKMQRVMEVYNLSMDIEAQLEEKKSWNT